MVIFAVEIKSLFVSNNAQAGLAIKPDNNARAKNFLILSSCEVNKLAASYALVSGEHQLSLGTIRE
jgi:hypothetical protein